MSKMKHKVLRLLPFGLVGIYILTTYTLALGRKIEFFVLGFMIIASLWAGSNLYKNGVIEQPKKRLTLATLAIAGSGLIFLVYLYFITTA